MDAKGIVAVILALCALVFFTAFPVLRYLLPPEVVPSEELIGMYQEVVGILIGGLLVYLGIKAGDK